MSSKLAVARAYFAARFPRRRDGQIPDTPVCDETELTAHFAEYNALGLSLEEARRLAEEEREGGSSPYPGYSFGLSSGTCGEPGVFITSQAERDRWLGSVLGKFLSPWQVLTLNAALLLKHNNRLYEASNRVHYFDIAKSAVHWAPRLCDLQPKVLIGPPSVLTALADSAAFHLRPFQPHTLISAAEPLFPGDRQRLAQQFQTAPRNLYQAKEGFLASGCIHGGLHWNDDLVALEVMRFKDRPDYAVPVITDFSRQSQTFRRYRLDDVIRLGGDCPCRTPLTKIRAVEGRLQDVLLLWQLDGDYLPVFPFELDEILNSVGDYTLTQQLPNHFSLECSATPRREVLQRLNHFLQQPARLDLVPFRSPEPGRKRRRFQRQFDPVNKIILEELLAPPSRLVR